MRGKVGKANGRNSGVTVIRREEVVEGGHHGGAWKVAYADFVTAMMAFFLLMWLLNATTEDQRKGLADYFSPNNLMSHASSGVGQPFGGHTVYDHGAMVSDRGAAQVLVGMRPVVQDPPEQDSDTPLVDDPHGAAAQAGPAGKTDAATPGSAEAKPAKPEPGDHGATSPGSGPGAASARATTASATNTGATGAALVGVASAEATKPPPVAARAETQPGNRAPTEADIRAAEAAREKLAFEQAAEQIRQAVRGDPALAELSRQLAIDITPEGLRIQLLDEERLPMFATGSSTPNERAGLLLAKVAPVLMRLPEDIAVVGHTDAAPYTGNGKTNWELSTERANATRRLLTGAGLAEARVSRVTGLADRDPLLPADPLAAANRRIAIIVLRGTQKPAAAPPAPPSIAVQAPTSVSPSTAAPDTSSAPPSPAGSASPSASPSTPAFARPSGPAPAPSPVPPSISGPAPSSTSPSMAAPTQSPAASPIPSSAQPFTPSTAPVSASLSAPSSTPSTASPSERAPSTPPSESASGPETARSSTPSFVPSFIPSFSVPSHAPSVAAPVLPEPPP